MRKLALILAWLAAFAPGWACALGLGDINLHSYLNQPIDADIQLVGVTAADLDSLKISLASPEQFREAGVEYRSDLQYLHFKVVRGAGGSAQVKVTTSKPFREPFLTFVLQATWSQGQVLREYTVLVDPPVTVPHKAPVTRAPAAVVAPKPTPKPAPKAQVQPVAPAPAAHHVAASAGPGSYGPTKRHDTLWNIARKVKPDTSVSTDQVMLALLRSNPQAFYDNNINRLKAGYVMKVPGRDAMISLSKAQAHAEVRRQNRVWRSGTAKAAKTVATAAPGGAPAKGHLELLAPKAAGAGAAGAAGAAGGGKGAVAGTSVQQQLAAAKETADAQRQENSDLRAQVAELQKQTQDLKRLAKLKNDQLAALQQQLAKLKGQAATAPQQPPAQAQKPAAALAATAAATKPPAAPTPKPKAPPVVESPAPPGMPINPYAVSGFKSVDTAKLPKGQPSHPFKSFSAAPKKVQASAPVPTSWTARIPEYGQQAWSALLANPLIGAAVGVLVLLVLGLIVVSRRRRAGAGFQESILREPVAAAATAGAAGDSGVEDVAATDAEDAKDGDAAAASSYLSDFAVSGMDSIQSEVGEADPLTEADVFLAYGRFQAAESMIKEAIDAEPDRLDLKLKLLEIYHAARNADAFENEAQALHGVVEDHEGATWTKVVEMGEDLCPDSPLFRKEDAVGQPAAESEPEPEDVPSEVQSPEAVGEEAFTVDLDEGAEAVTEAKADDNLIDFDLGELEGTAEAADQAGTQESAEAADDLGLDFDLGEESEQKPQEAAPASGDDQFAADLADELAGITESISGGTTDEAAVEPGLGTEETQELHFEPVETAVAGEPAGADEEQSEEESAGADGGLLADVDEVGTKLDLAKAYIDMGDPEGARSILDEVLEEGSEQQRSEAHELMSQIS